MTIYLPIAELPINIFFLIALGGIGGILAGMFGIGGGFLITPILIFIGVPPAVAVATSTNQIIASSVSGFLSHWYRRNVDILMGGLMLVGGLIGAVLGIWMFKMLQTLGLIDVVISLSYVVFLGFIGTVMFIESLTTLIKGRRKLTKKESRKIRKEKRSLGEKIRSLPLPFKIYFPKSELTISALLPVIVGVLAGIMVSLMGIGGGFVMIPAMIYLLGMPTSVVVGTSLFQIIFTTALVTFLHATSTQSVDMLLAVILIIGAVVGAQFGSRIGAKLKAENLRIILAVIVLAVCTKLGIGLFLEPDNLYSIEELIG